MGHSHGESPYRRGSSPSPTMSEEEEERSLDEERSDPDRRDHQNRFGHPC